MLLLLIYFRYLIEKVVFLPLKTSILQVCLIFSDNFRSFAIQIIRNLSMKRIIYIVLFTIFSIAAIAQPSSDKLIRQGASFHDKGRYAEAISCYQQALKVNPSSMSAVYEMSLSYLKMEDYDNAIKHSTQVINVGFRPLLVDAYVVKGTALAAQDKLDDAIVLFSQAISQCGDEYLLNYNLGLSYYNKGNTNLALVHLRKAIEKDATHSGAFLLYAYALNDAGSWVQSFYAFHFFLLLEPNTKRSADAFREMYQILDSKLDSSDAKLRTADGLDRKMIYNKIQQHRPSVGTRVARYKFFESASREVFTYLSTIDKVGTKGLLWEFFVPVFSEVLESGHFETYCKYVSVAYFPESLQWWDANKTEVDNFIEWFEHGQSPDVEEDAYFEGEE